MTYADFFSEFKQKFEGTDVSDITEHLAYQFNIEDDQAGGAFYVEVKEGKLHIEPYEYYDRDAAFTCKPEVLNQIISGELDPVKAFSFRKLKVDGSLDKALRLKDLVEKKKEQEEKVRKEQEAQKKEAEKKAAEKKLEEKKAEEKKAEAKQEEKKAEESWEEKKPGAKKEPAGKAKKK